jgi:Ni2+-binding GTPase involved in maturation of urease and hydrogenase
MTFVSGLQIASSRFVKNARVGAGVLGVYGTIGVGKSTLCKALCDSFSGEFFGRVCYVDVGERNKASKLQQMKLILERLCGFDKDALRRITHSRQVIFVSSILIS